MSTANRVIKNTGFLYIRTVVSLIVNVFTTRILFEALGASDYGLYNVVGGSITMLGFISASMSATTQRFISHAEGSGNHDRVISIFNNALLIHNLLAVLSVIIMSIAGIFFFNGILSIPEGKETAALFVYACLMVSTAFSITVVPYEAEINAHENMLFYSLVGIIDVLLKFAIALLILYCEEEQLIIYAVCMAVESTFLRVISQWYCRKNYKECRKPNIRRLFNRGVIKEMLSFTGWNTCLTATSMVGLFGMNLVINHFFGVKLNAAMGIATQLSGVLMGLSMNMIKALTPVLVKSEGGNKRDDMLRISIVGSKFSFLIFSFCGIPVLFYLTPLLNLWLTDVPEWTITFCLILIITQLTEQLTVVLFQTISAEGHIKNFSIYRSVANIIPLIISVALYSTCQLAPYWILVLWFICKGVVSGLINVYYAHKNAGMDIKMYLTHSVLPCFNTVVASSMVYYVVQCFDEHFDVNFIVPFAISIILSIPIYYYLALDSNERNLFSGIISKVYSKIHFN